MMATMMSSGTDVVAFLKDQHREIKARFDEVVVTHGEERKRAFDALRRLLAVHETAEEEIVHPAARRALPNGELIATARLQEENEAKEMLSDLEDMEVDSSQFDTTFLQFDAAALVAGLASCSRPSRGKRGVPAGNRRRPQRHAHAHHER
jgi:hemerythrin superfamily protein